MKIFGIAGHSGMGKTTLLERLVPALVVARTRRLADQAQPQEHRHRSPGQGLLPPARIGLQGSAAAGQRPLGADARAARRRRAAAGLPARPPAALRPGVDRGLQDTVGSPSWKSGGLKSASRPCGPSGRGSWPSPAIRRCLTPTLPASACLTLRPSLRSCCQTPQADDSSGRTLTKSGRHGPHACECLALGHRADVDAANGDLAVAQATQAVQPR